MRRAHFCMLTLIGLMRWALLQHHLLACSLPLTLTPPLQ
jgi:hypothetical protein